MDDGNPDEVDLAAELFSTLAHPGRLQVLRLLALEGPMTAGTLAERIGLEQSAMSHQLRALREARLVDANREGRHVIYGIADHHVSHIVTDALKHVREPRSGISG